MARGVLDPTLLSKLSNLYRNKIPNVRVMVSKKANKLGISAEAALIILAKEKGIGTSTYQRSLDASKQAEVRDALPAVIFSEAPAAAPAAKGKKAKQAGKSVTKKQSLRQMVEYLIQDKQLLQRCGDTLLAGSHFDRAINQATLILEDRIRKKSGGLKDKRGKDMSGDALVGAAFNPEISETLLRVSSNDADDQRGFAQILRGMVPSFRNRTHHHVTDEFSREDAMRVCGFIDVLLRVVDESVKKE